MKTQGICLFNCLTCQLDGTTGHTLMSCSDRRLGISESKIKGSLGVNVEQVTNSSLLFKTYL